MRRARPWLNLLLLLAPAGLLCLFAGLMVRRVWKYLNTGPRLAGILSVEATHSLGRDVRVRSVVFKLNPWSLLPNRPNRVEFGGISIAQGLDPHSGPLALADRVVVRFDLRQALLATDIKVPYVDSVSVVGAQAYLARNAAGKWNFPQIIKPGARAGRPFANKISFQNSAVYYTDDALPHPPGVARQRLQTHVDHLEGVVLLRPNHSTAFDVAGDGAANLLHEFHVTGIVQDKPLRLNARLIGRDINFPPIARQFLPPATGHVTAGHGDVDLSILYEPPVDLAANTFDLKSLDLQGTVGLRDVGAAAQGMSAPVTNVTGDLTLAPDSVVGRLTGQFVGTSFDVQGKALDVREAIAMLRRRLRGSRSGGAVGAPAIALQATIHNGDYQRIVRGINLGRFLGTLNPKTRYDVLHAVGHGDFDLRVVGPLSDPTAALRARLPMGRYDRYRGDDIDLRAFYAHNAVDVDARGRYAHGQAAARAHVVTDPRQAFEAEAHGRNIQLAALKSTTGLEMGGQGQVDFAIQGESHVTPSITAQAEVTDARYAHQQLHSIYAYATTVGDRLMRWGEFKPDPQRLKRLRLQTLRVDDPKGFALASGTIDLKSQALDITLDADELDLGAIAKTARQGAHETGKPVPAPQLSSPSAAEAAPPLFDMNALQGTGYVRTHLGGTLKRPELSGQVSLYALQAGRALLDSLGADFSLNRQALVINRATARRYPGRATVTGSVTALNSKDPKLDLTASLADVDVTDMLDLARGPQKAEPNATSKDRLAVTGTLYSGPIEIGGTVHDLVLNRPVLLRLQGAAVNGLPLTRVEVEASYGHAGLNIARAELDTAGGAITATGNVGKDFLDLTVNGSNLSLQQLTSALPADADTTVGPATEHRAPTTFDPHSLRGAIGFQAHIGGAPQAPAVTAQLNVGDLGYRDFTLGDVQGKARYADRRVSLMDVAVREPQPPVGSLPDIRIGDLAYNTARGTLAGQIAWNDVPLQRLTDLLTGGVIADDEGNNPIADTVNAVARPLTGLLSGTLALSGTVEKPSASVTWSAHDIKIKDEQITSITGSAHIDPDQLQIPAPDHAGQPARIDSPDGTIAIDKILIARDPKHADDGTLDADVSAFHINLALLRNWLPATTEETNWFRDAARQASGTGDLYFTASGTVKKPVVTASANLSDLTYGGITVDRINLSKAIISEPQIQFSDIEFTKRRIAGEQNSEKFIARLANGKIDFRWKPPFIAKDAVIDIDADVPEQDVKVLSAFSRPLGSSAGAGLLAADTEGSFSAHAHVGGTVDQPRPSGSVNVRASQLQFTGVRTGLKDLAAQLNFENGNVSVASGFTGHTTLFGAGIPAKNREGGPIDLHGSLPLFPTEGTVSDQQIVLTAPDIKFDESPFPGTATPGGRGSGSLRGDATINIALKRAFTRPIIAGTVSIYDTTLTPPSGFPAGSGGGLALPVNPEFDLTLNVGKNVRISNPLFNARVDGSVRITGNLFKRTPNLGSELEGVPGSGGLFDPSLSSQLAGVEGRGSTANVQPSNIGLNLLGTLTVREGKLTLPTGRFTILPPGTQAPGTFTLRFPDYDPSQPGQPGLGVNIDVAAQTYLVLPSSNSINGRKSYRVTVVARGPVTGLATDPLTGRPRLTLNFQTDPPDFTGNPQLLEQQVANTLGGPALEGTGRNPGTVISQQLTSVFTNYAIPGLFDRPAAELGFEELGFLYDPVQQLSLVVSRRLIGPLYITYIRSLGAGYETFDLKASLRFSPRYQLSYEVDEQNTQRLLLEGVLKF